MGKPGLFASGTQHSGQTENILCSASRRRDGLERVRPGFEIQGRRPHRSRLYGELLPHLCQLSGGVRTHLRTEFIPGERQVSSLRSLGTTARRAESVALRGPPSCGIAGSFFHQEKIFVTTEALFALWRAIAELSADPAIRLKLGTESRVER